MKSAEFIYEGETRDGYKIFRSILPRTSAHLKLPGFSGKCDIIPTNRSNIEVVAIINDRAFCCRHRDSMATKCKDGSCDRCPFHYSIAECKKRCDSSNIMIPRDATEPVTIKGFGSLCIKVPIGTNLDIRTSYKADIRVGDIKGDLRIDVQSRGCGRTPLCSDVSVGSVKNLHGSVSGAARLMVEYVAGDAILEANDYGNIIVKNGNINMLEACVWDDGNIKVHAPAQCGKLSTHGNGDFYAERFVLHHSEQVNSAVYRDRHYDDWLWRHYPNNLPISWGYDNRAGYRLRRRNDDR